MFKVSAMQPKYLPKYAKMFAAFLKGDKPDEFEFTYIHKDGSIRWGDSRFAMIRSNKGIEIIVILIQI